MNRIGCRGLNTLVYVATLAGIAGTCRAQSGAQLLLEADRLAWLKNWSRAEPLFSKAEALFDAEGDERNAIYARISAIRSRLPRLNLIETSQDLADYLQNPIVKGDPKLTLRCLIVKGDVDMDLDDGLAKEDWMAARDLAKSLNDADWEARATGELGIVAFLQGDHSGAVIGFTIAISHAVKSGDLGAQIRFLTLVGRGLIEFGRPEQALEYLDRALTLVASTSDLADPLMTYDEKARALGATGRITEARALLQRALDIAHGHQSYGYEADLMVQLAQLSATAHDQKRSNGELQEALELAKKGDARRLISQASLELSKSWRAAGNLEQAELVLSGGIEATRRAGDRYTLPRYLAAYADVKVTLKQYRQAEELFEEATDIANGMLGNVSSSSAKSSLIAVMDDLYLGHFLLDARYLKNPTRALRVIEEARGRSVSDLLRLPPGTRSKLETGITAQKKQISILQLALLNSRDKAQRKQVLDRLLVVEQSIGAVEAANSRMWMRTSEPISANALRVQLRPDEALIEYVLAEPVSYCLVATRETLRLYPLAGKATTLQSVGALLDDVRQGKQSRPLASTVYTELLGGIPELASHQRVIVVPDGILTNLPFEILVTPLGENLLQSHTVSYVPSGTALALIRQGSSSDPAPARLLAVAGAGPEDESEVAVSVQRGVYDIGGSAIPPLPAAADEAEAVAQIVGGKSIVLKGASATESAFKRQPLAEFQILHFAVHGLVSTRYPDRSALVFRADPAGNEDGLLQAREIAVLPIRARLVTLSACDTGSGKINGQEGSSSMVRPFLVAGAKSVVANLWSADDDFTRTLMKEFYTEMATGLDVASALRKAKLGLTRRYGAAAVPRLWAGFVVVGDGAQIPVKAYARKN